MKRIVDNINHRKHLVDSMKLFQAICRYSSSSYYHPFSKELVNVENCRGYAKYLLRYVIVAEGLLQNIVSVMLRRLFRATLEGILFYRSMVELLS